MKRSCAGARGPPRCSLRGHMNRKERRLALWSTATVGSALPPAATARSVPPAAATEAGSANRKDGGSSAHSRVVEFNKRIHALGRERKLGAAFTCFEELLAEGLKPTAVTFNVLIGVAAKCGDNGRAATLLADMRSRSLVPTATTYAAVVNGLCLTGELQAAEATLMRAVEQLHTVPDLRSCKAYLRACLVWGDVERVEPFVDRMLSEWSVPLDTASADYAGRCLCMGLRVEAAEALLARQPQLTPSVALHLAFATAHAARLEWSRAAARLRSASARLEEGAETALFEDRDEQSTEGWQQQAFLQHREAESRRELERLRQLLAARGYSLDAPPGSGPADAPATARAVADGNEDAARPTKRRKRGAASTAADSNSGGGDDNSSGGGEDKPSATELHRHLRQTEALYARVVLVSQSTAKLAATPLAEQPPAYGQTPKALRRWRLAALLTTRLDRLGLSTLQALCARADDGAVAKSERRVLKRAKRACNSKCQVRWATHIFGGGAGGGGAARAASTPIHLEIGSGSGEWVAAQARTAPHVNWVAGELRGDRIHQIFDRLRTESLPNLAVLGGDAALALRHHVRPRSFSSIWVTFPEPPADHDDGTGYLLGAPFLWDALLALVADGRLLIISDNLELLDRVSETLLSMRQHGAAGASAFHAASGTASGAQAVKARIGPAGCQLVTEGWPAGFGDGGASYFDRLWASRAKQRRFYIEVRRPTARC